MCCLETCVFHWKHCTVVLYWLFVNAVTTLLYSLHLSSKVNTTPKVILPCNDKYSYSSLELLSLLKGLDQGSWSFYIVFIWCWFGFCVHITNMPTKHDPPHGLCSQIQYFIWIGTKVIWVRFHTCNFDSDQTLKSDIWTAGCEGSQKHPFRMQRAKGWPG